MLASSGPASWFQSVSGLWDRRNRVAAAVHEPVQVSIRLRSVGPEKFDLVARRFAGLAFQSVSGLWDRRNQSKPSRSGQTSSFNPSPVCGTGEIWPG